MDIEQLKNMPVNEEYIAAISIPKIINIATLWPKVFKSAEKSAEYNSSPDGLALWATVTYDAELLCMECGTNAEAILWRLVVAYIIYPDGTFNQQFLNDLKTKGDANAATKRN